MCLMMEKVLKVLVTVLAKKRNKAHTYACAQARTNTHTHTHTHVVAQVHVPRKDARHSRVRVDRTKCHTDAVLWPCSTDRLDV